MTIFARSLSIVSKRSRKVKIFLIGRKFFIRKISEFSAIYPFR